MREQEREREEKKKEREREREGEEGVGTTRRSNKVFARAGAGIREDKKREGEKNELKK